MEIEPVGSRVFQINCSFSLPVGRCNNPKNVERPGNKDLTALCGASHVNHKPFSGVDGVEWFPGG